MIMQDSKLDEIQQRLMKLSPAPNDAMAAPANADLDTDDQKD